MTNKDLNEIKDMVAFAKASDPLSTSIKVMKDLLAHIEEQDSEIASLENRCESLAENQCYHG